MPYNIYRVMYTHQGPGEDAFSNVWHVATANTQAIDNSGPGITEGNGVFNAFYNFYNDWAPAGMSPAADNAGTSVKMYNVTVPTGDHAPVYAYTYNTYPYQTVGSSSFYFPWEVAVCLSFEAFISSGTNRARRRGRVYLGPLTTDCAEYDGFGYCGVSPTFRAAVLDAYKTMVDSLLALGYETGPYSKVDNLFHNTATAWVDDAFDTQRRRGNQPSTQTRADRLVDNTGWV